MLEEYKKMLEEYKNSNITKSNISKLTLGNCTVFQLFFLNRNIVEKNGTSFFLLHLIPS